MTWGPVRCPKPLGALVSAWGILRTLWINKPFVMDVTGQTWTENPNIKSNGDVFVRIPKKLHKKGKFPTVHIVKSAYDPAFGEIDFKIQKCEDVMLYHSSNHLMPPWKEFTVKIEA
jgi:hypothetical protein